MRSRNKNKLRFLLLKLSAASLIIIMVALGVMWLVDNKMPGFQNDGVIRVYPYSTLEDVREQIDCQLRPKFRYSIDRVFLREHMKERLTPGYYRIKASDPVIYLARVLTHGWETPVNFTLSGRIHKSDMIASKLSKQLMIDSTSLMKALNDSRLLEKYGTSPSHLFEFIIPDTYEVYWSARPEEILDRFKSGYDAFWNEERLQAARQIGLKPSEVSVLASIVAEESNKPDEYPKIASVYLTRLRKGMKLQACPTVCYLFDYSIRRVLYSHINTPSPYNTYMNEGLPPTPISLPDKCHLEAVLHPDKTPYLYFCADAQLNGRNVFSTTFAEHSAKARAYQEAYEKRQAEKAAGISQDGMTVGAPMVVDTAEVVQ